jgi:hypothetical protein
MRRRLAFVVSMIAALASVAALAACGAEDVELEVIEGEPVEFEDVSYNVVISRFLNPDDEEDAEYLVGQPDPPQGDLYFGVFMQIENEREDSITVPEEMTVVDTLDTEYVPVETESPYALPLGSLLDPGDALPVADSTAATGPIEGSMVLFLLPEASTENRPLELEIPIESETAVVELDI